MMQDEGPQRALREPLGPGAVLLHEFAASQASALFRAMQEVAGRSPFRHMTTPGGYRMSVAMTNCGPLGWVSDRSGYRYDPVDPDSGAPWPSLPEVFRRLAAAAASEDGFANYAPDACLINRYEPGSKLSMHIDKDENDPVAPIVSVSLGLPAVFLWGGKRRADLPRRIRLESGDVVVWGGPARFIYHGVAPLPDGDHPLTGRLRVNLTFRKVL
jgi:alkylated DNA repair protein (DNA oxidative demethylase)